MKPENAQRDRQAREIFFRAVEISSADARATYLAGACGGDVELTIRVEDLLANHVPDSFLEKPADAAVLVSLANLPLTQKVGDRIGRYKLLQQIGEGGCGVVYMAEQEEPVRRRVALKVIKLGMDTRQVVARFEAERQALAMMDHPNIARVFDAGATQAGRPYFVMELVRGIRITEYCDQQKLSTRQRLDLFLQVCSAVQHAHQKGIIHRDLKPSNILVTRPDGPAGAGVPKVIDFGIAKATNQQRLTDKTLFTAFEQFIGTPAYMSPEQAEFSGVDIDTRSDIYSLGVVLYELLTGRTPFDATQLLRSGLEGIRKTLREQEPSKPSTTLDTMAQADLTTVARARQTAPPRLRHQVRGDLDWVVMKCLEKERSRRYDTANGLAQDLLRHLQNEPVTARPPSAAYKLQKAWRRNQLAFTAGTAVATALVIGLGLATWAWFRQHESLKLVAAAEAEQRRERETATQERDRAAILLSQSQAERGVQLLEKNDPVGLLYLLEARKSVEHLPEARLRRTLLWSGWMESLPPPFTRVLPSPSPLDRVAYDPHRPWQATGATNGQVILWETGTGRRIDTLNTGNRPVGSTDFSANGRLLIVNAGGLFQLWDLAPLRSNQPPRQLLAKILRVATDPHRRRLVTFANQGLPLPGGDALATPPARPVPPIYQIQVWDSAQEPALVTTWEGDRSDLANHQFALSPDGSKVAAGWHAVSIWDAATGQRFQPPPSTNGLSTTRGFFDPLHFSPNGRWLWEVRGNTCLRYDLTTGQRVGDTITGLDRHQRPWLASTGQHLVLALEGGFQVVHLDRGESMGPMIPRDETTSARALALSLDGGRLVTAGPDRALQVWNTLTGQTVGPTIVPPSAAANAAFSADGQSLTITTQEGHVGRHQITAPPPTAIQEWSGTQVIGFNAIGHLLTYAIASQTMQWRSPATGKPTSAAWKIPDSGPLIGSALSPNSETAATAIQTGKAGSVIRFWDTATGIERGGPITWTNYGPLAFSPDGKALAGLGGGDGSIQLWDVASGERRASMSLPEPPQVSWLGLRFRPDGLFLAARNSYALSVWDVIARQSATGSTRDFYLAISQDWKLALTDRELLDFSDPRNPRPAPNPINSRNTPSDRGGMALSPDNRWRTSGSGRFWDTITGRPVGQEQKTSGTPTAMAFSPDSRLFVKSEIDLASRRGGPRGFLRLWETSTGLPCGPAVPQLRMTIDLWFDRDVRFLAAGAPFNADGVQILKLPVRDLPLTGMERQSWLRSGSRLDEAGNVEILSAAEIRELEASTPVEDPPAESPAPTGPAHRDAL